MANEIYLIAALIISGLAILFILINKKLTQSIHIVETKLIRQSKYIKYFIGLHQVNESICLKCSQTGVIKCI